VKLSKNYDDSEPNGMDPTERLPESAVHAFLEAKAHLPWSAVPLNQRKPPPPLIEPGTKLWSLVVTVATISSDEPKIDIRQQPQLTGLSAKIDASFSTVDPPSSPSDAVPVRYKKLKGSGGHAHFPKL
jgi:hypothetical protein